MIQLASILVRKPVSPNQDKEVDYEEAQQFLQDAVDLLDALGPPARSELRRALRELRSLYSEDVWDFPQGRAEVEEYLKDIEREAHRATQLPAG